MCVTGGSSSAHISQLSGTNIKPARSSSRQSKHAILDTAPQTQQRRRSPRIPESSHPSREVKPNTPVAAFHCLCINQTIWFLITPPGWHLLLAVAMETRIQPEAQGVHALTPPPDPFTSISTCSSQQAWLDSYWFNIKACRQKESNACRRDSFIYHGEEGRRRRENNHKKHA